MNGLPGISSRSTEQSGVYHKGKLIFPGVCTISTYSAQLYFSQPQHYLSVFTSVSTTLDHISQGVRCLFRKKVIVKMNKMVFYPKVLTTEWLSKYYFTSFEMQFCWRQYFQVNVQKIVIIITKRRRDLRNYRNKVIGNIVFYFKNSFIMLQYKCEVFTLNILKFHQLYRLFIFFFLLIDHS